MASWDLLKRDNLPLRSDQGGPFQPMGSEDPEMPFYWMSFHIFFSLHLVSLLCFLVTEYVSMWILFIENVQDFRPSCAWFTLSKMQQWFLWDFGCFLSHFHFSIKWKTTIFLDKKKTFVLPKVQSPAPPPSPPCSRRKHQEDSKAMKKRRNIKSAD